MFKQLIEFIMKTISRRRYWYVTDFWETFCTVPVIFDGYCFVWHLGDGLTENFYKHEINPQRLYRKRKRAERAAAKLNERAKNYDKL